MSNIASIGHNSPPTSDFDEVKAEIDNLYEEAKGWLDGAPIESEEMAEGVSTLMNMIRKAGKKAEGQRKEEKAPHLAASKDVDARYKPLSEMATRATDACKQALAPWLKKKEEEQRAAAEAARLEAERKEREAQEAFAKMERTNLDQVEEAERLYHDAKKAEAVANRAEKAKAGAASGVGRAAALRTTYTPVLTDPVEAIRHYWPNDQINDTLISLARKDVTSGKREIPGFEVREEKSVV